MIAAPSQRPPRRRWVLPLRIVLYGLMAFLAWRAWKVRATETPEVAALRRSLAPALQALCQQAGVPYPPRALFLRGFKAEKELEAWAPAADGTYRLLKTYPVLAASGVPGPKRREGDRQVPEGFYRVVIFNPKSSYHLSLGLDYPNASDQVRSDLVLPGSDIYIHGSDGSVGCLAMGDPAIEEIYVLGLLAGGPGAKHPVHLFPHRMVGPEWETWRTAEVAKHPELAPFWAELQPGFDAFEQTHQVPRVTVIQTGAYQLK